MIRVEGARPQLPRGFRSSKKMPGTVFGGRARQSQEITHLLREQPRAESSITMTREGRCHALS